MNMKIILVDDKEENLYMLESLLTGNGYQIKSTQNGIEALAELKDDKYDLIISDILMPVMDGFAFCRECKKDETLKNIPFIFYTATYTDKKDEEFALSLGADRFVLKPQDPDVFIEIVRELLHEVEDRKLIPRTKNLMPENVLLKEYNAALIRKLEDKMQQSEENEKKLKIYVNELEKNIEERAAIEKELSESEERYRLILENSMDAILFTAPDGSIFSANKAACELFQMTEEEIIQKGRNGIVDQSDPNLQILMKERREKGKAKGQLIFTKKDGTKFPAEMTSSIFTTSEGEKRSTTIIRDITEQMRVNQELIDSKNRAEKLNRLKTEFLAQMSHEIRSPLNAILNFAQVIKEEVNDEENETLEVAFSAIDSASKRMIRTVDSILNMSELQLGTYELSIERTNLVHILKSLISEYQGTADLKKLNLNFVTAFDEAIINTDDYAVKQIVANLIDNALKYTNDGGVEVKLYKNNDSKFCIEISDTGIGISEEFLPYLFDPFRQEEQGYSRTFDGSGLGMALTDKYCKLINADIQVDSQKYKGTTFYITLGDLKLTK